jgi:glutathione S-transferase-like protein
VYKAGFANSQGAYELAVRELFTALEHWEQVLERQRYLCGDVLTEADICFYNTLVRFDFVYYSHFKCNLARVQDYPNLLEPGRGESLAHRAGGAAGGPAHPVQPGSARPEEDGVHPGRHASLSPLPPHSAPFPLRPLPTPPPSHSAPFPSPPRERDGVRVPGPGVEPRSHIRGSRVQPLEGTGARDELECHAGGRARGPAHERA